MFADLTTTPELSTQFDVMLCCDLNYDRSATPGERAVLEGARAAGARILVADAGRTYFDASGLTLLGTFEVPVPKDLEGGELRVAHVYEG
jgi:predicted nicotinamide N-methyase